MYPEKIAVKCPTCGWLKRVPRSVKNDPPFAAAFIVPCEVCEPELKTPGKYYDKHDQEISVNSSEQKGGE
jgi:uncharacterized Zn finger protein